MNSLFGPVSSLVVGYFSVPMSPEPLIIRLRINFARTNSTWESGRALPFNVRSESTVRQCRDGEHLYFELITHQKADCGCRRSQWVLVTHWCTGAELAWASTLPGTLRQQYRLSRCLTRRKSTGFVGDASQSCLASTSSRFSIDCDELSSKSQSVTEWACLHVEFYALCVIQRDVRFNFRNSKPFKSK